MAHMRKVRLLPMGQVRAGAAQAGMADVAPDLDELVASIRIQGQLEPIIVIPSETDSTMYDIIAGQRRWLAMRRLGAEAIQAVVLDEVDEVTAQAISVTEHAVRRDLSEPDLIDVCTRLYRQYGSMKAVAEELGLPYGKVRSYVRFERLRGSLRDLVLVGRIDVRTALRLEDHYGDEEVGSTELDAVVEALRGMTNAQKADYLAALRADPTLPARPPGADRDAAPGSVRQILVTLRSGEVEHLRRWAREHNLTQDAAVRRILRAFLHSRMAESTTKDANAADGAARKR